MLFSFFWLLISSINLYALKSLTASASSTLLTAFGVPNALSFGVEPAITVKNVSAQITNLCAGDIEIALLAAIVLSTFDRPLRRRLWGVAFGVLTILIVNPIRISTVLATGYYTNWQWADFTHDILFRLTLLVIIVGYYFVWYVKYDSIKKRLKLK